MARNYGRGSVSGSAGYRGGPYTQDSREKDYGYKGGRMETEEVAQKIEDWSMERESPMKQESSGSMDYKSKKEEIMREDARKISGQMLPQK
jgi:hypothetical protein